MPVMLLQHAINQAAEIQDWKKMPRCRLAEIYQNHITPGRPESRNKFLDSGMRRNNAPQQAAGKTYGGLTSVPAPENRSQSQQATAK